MRENKGRRIVTFATGTITATLILGLVTTTAPADARTSIAPRPAAAPSVNVSPPSARIAGARTTARWSGAVNPYSEQSVNAAYQSAYAPKLSLPVDWIGGSLLGCLAGLTSGETNNATLSALNYVRSLAGLAPVTFSRALNASAQKAALIMAANNNLSHYPSSGWRCWTPAGADAASRSDLALAYPSLSAGQIVQLYMDDPGGSNVAAGHRRWILNPFSTVMGSGTTLTANALTVIGPSSSSRPNPRWVGWPAAGYFPNALEPGGRWSLSAGNSSVTFRQARVAVYQGTARIPVHRYPIHVGYGQPTLVWQMPASFDKTKAYRVVVKGIKRPGSRRSFGTSYTVRLFTPSQ